MKGFIFRQSKPAVFGVEVIAGTIKPKYKLKKGDKVIGEVKQIQSESHNIDEAKMGDKVALSMPDVTIGKEVSEGDVLETCLNKQDIELLQKVKVKLRADEKELLEEICGGSS